MDVFVVSVTVMIHEEFHLVSPKHTTAPLSLIIWAFSPAQFTEVINSGRGG